MSPLPQNAWIAVFMSGFFWAQVTLFSQSLAADARVAKEAKNKIGAVNFIVTIIVFDFLSRMCVDVLDVVIARSERTVMFIV